MSKTACAQCPWRLSNQGKKHPGGFYRKANLRRLWNQIRGGGAAQSCHLTDPSHPDHVAAGAPEGATAQECPGSVALVMREFRAMATPEGHIGPEEVTRYCATRPKGLTRKGLLYWLIARYQHGGVPYIGGPKLPIVDVDDPEVGLPSELDPRGARP